MEYKAIKYPLSWLQDPWKSGPQSPVDLSGGQYHFPIGYSKDSS